jgi:hypothetical protein
VSSDEQTGRNMERERFVRDTIRARMIEVDPGVWVRGDRIDMVRAAAEGSPVEEGAGCVFSLMGWSEVITSHLTPEQLLRAIVAGRQA